MSVNKNFPNFVRYTNHTGPSFSIDMYVYMYVYMFLYTYIHKYICKHACMYAQNTPKWDASHRSIRGASLGSSSRVLCKAQLRGSFQISSICGVSNNFSQYQNK